MKPKIEGLSTICFKRSRCAGSSKVGRNADLIQGHEREKYRLRMPGKHLTERAGRLRLS